MKTIITIRERIAVRAYFAWQNGSSADDASNWNDAEQIEQAYADRRAASARKAAETRKAKAASTAPAEMLVATTVRRGAARRPTAH